MLTPKEIYMSHTYNKFLHHGYGCDSNYNENTIIENRFMINDCSHIPPTPCVETCVPPTIISATRTGVGVQPIILTVTSTGTLPIKHQWYKNGVYIAGATSSSYMIPNSVLAPEGTYKVAVWNQCGTVISENIIVNPGEVPPPDPGPEEGTAPVITVHPSSNVNVTAGQNITLSVTATSTTPMTYQWRRNGVNISGATSSSYTITNVQSGNTGAYTVVVTNSYGSTTSNTANIALADCSTPVITVQPTSSTTLTVGQQYSLSVTATSTSSMTYQWRKNGVNISGATSSSYNIPTVQTGDSGTYTVVITNSCGSSTSNNASLTVNAVVTYDISMTFLSAGSASSGDTYTSATAQINSGNIGSSLKLEFNQLPGVLTGIYGTMYIYMGSATSGNLRMLVNFRPEYNGQTFRFTDITGTQYTSTFATGNKIF